MELENEYLASIHIRRACASDFKYMDEGHEYPRYGVIYTIAMEDGNFTNFRVFSESTDLHDIANWLREGIIYVPGTSLEKASIYRHTFVQE